MKWFFGVIAAIMALSVVGCAIDLIMTPVNGVVGVVHRTFDPDKMISDYHYFHEASNTISSFPDRIEGARQAVVDAQSDGQGYTASRRTELTGLQATCLQLIADYNARASRVDSGFLQNPEHYLPFSAAGYTPLPVLYDNSVCN